jgi:hypothetical protein
LPLHHPHELSKRKTDPQGQAGRLAVQGVWLRDFEEDENLRAEEGEEVAAAIAGGPPSLDR